MTHFTKRSYHILSSDKLNINFVSAIWTIIYVAHLPCTVGYVELAEISLEVVYVWQV